MPSSSEMTTSINHEKIADNQSVFSYVFDYLKALSQKLLTPTEKASYVISALSRIIRALGFIITNLLKITHEVLRAVPWIANIILLISASIKAINALTSTSESMPTRGAKLTASILRIGFGVASIVLMSLVLVEFILPIIIATIATEIVLNTFLIGESIYNRFFGAWKKEKTEQVILKNDMIDTYNTYTKTKTDLETLQKNAPASMEPQQQLSLECQHLKEKIIRINTETNDTKNIARDRYRDIADKSHLTLIAGVSLIGAALLLTPFATVGAGLLIGAAAYSILVKLEINPVKWLSIKIFGDPFQRKIAVTDFNNIAMKLEKRIHKTEALSVAAKATSSTTNVLRALDTPNTKIIFENKNQATIETNENRTNSITNNALARPTTDDFYHPSPHPR